MSSSRTVAKACKDVLYYVPRANSQESTCLGEKRCWEEEMEMSREESAKASGQRTAKVAREANRPFAVSTYRRRREDSSRVTQEDGNSLSRNTFTNTCSQTFVFYHGSSIFSPARCCQYFFENWKKLTNDSSIFELVRGYQIPFLPEPYQGFSTRSNSISPNKIVLIDQEIKTV